MEAEEAYEKLWEVVNRFCCWRHENDDPGEGDLLDELMETLPAPADLDDGWVSVEERLPEEYQPVLVHGGCAFMDDGEWRTYMEKRHPSIQWTVTHWQPLPAPPKGEPS